ncbi:MAG: glycosyltransferase [Bacteroidota bacterium]|nr:glycosyltransferase [Bacteroidota bacterium]
MSQDRHKIIITVTSDILHDHRVQRIASCLVENWFDVLIIGRTKTKITSSDLGFKVKYLNCIFKSSVLFYAEYNVRLVFYLLFKKFDSLYSCDLDTLSGASLISLIKRKRLLFDAHEYFEESPEIVGKKWVQKTWEGIARMCLPLCSIRITVSESLAKALEQKYNLSFSVIRNVPNLSIYEINQLEKGKVIWYQGVLNKGRGLEEIIRTMALLPEYKLYLAGEGDIQHELKRLVVELNLHSSVTFLGRLSQNELKEQIVRARIGLNLLSNESLNYYYSLANKTFDYIQANLPALHMNFPEYSQLMTKYKVGLLLNDLEIESLRQSIIKLEEDTFYNSCVENCSKAAKEFCWENEKIKLIQLINHSV